jgi:pathogenesis-related protein 1
MKISPTKLMAAAVWGAAGACGAQTLGVAQQAEMLAAHNTWRREAGVPDVSWSPALAASAQQWADSLKARQACSLTHSGMRGLGENLLHATAMRYSDGTTRVQAMTPARVTASWAGEKADYDYAGNTCASGKMCGHYTQVVWRTTREIGCARAVCGNHSQVWVCHYAPPGNWRGQKPF